MGIVLMTLPRKTAYLELNWARNNELGNEIRRILLWSVNYLCKVEATHQLAQAMSERKADIPRRDERNVLTKDRNAL